jgi:co-chaperonin GroES (HSP10)
MSEGGIEIPEAYRGKSTEAIVRGVGAGETEFTLGDRVVINRHVPGTPITLHPRKLRLVRQGDVQAVFV